MSKSQDTFYGKFVKKIIFTRCKINHRRIIKKISTRKITKKILNSELVLEQKNVFADFSKTLNKDSKNLLSSFDKIAKKSFGLKFKAGRAIA